jgi:hypothetical protein
VACISPAVTTWRSNGTYFVPSTLSAAVILTIFIEYEGELEDHKRES